MKYLFQNRGMDPETIEADSYRVRHTGGGGSLGWNPDRFWVEFERDIPNPPQYGPKSIAILSAELSGPWEVRELTDESK